MVPLARRHLFAEKGRFAMPTVGVAFAVLLVLVTARKRHQIADRVERLEYGKVTSVEERTPDVASL